MAAHVGTGRLTGRRRSNTRLDEDDVRVRPGKGSRPRSSLRPAHADATTGQIVTVDRGRVTVHLADGVAVQAVKARELGRRGLVVGDRVELVGDLSGAPDTLARVVRIADRTSVLRRTADDTDPVERVLVANADQLVIVTALAEPEPRPRMIDRCLVAAYDAGLRPLLCLTKADLADPRPLLDAYAPLGVAHVTTRRTSDSEFGDPFELLAELKDRVSVLVGHSGVGKSTLVNALVPGTDRATGGVNAVTGRGRHTSSSALALALPDGGWVIDTPGVRSFGLAHVSPDSVLAAFTDLAGGADLCPRGCRHEGDDCALDEWVAAGHASAARLDSLRRLLRIDPTPETGLE
ncbi:MAG: ribosome small subunit-dependent GTPase A [Sporichthyaceae bacterium]